MHPRQVQGDGADGTRTRDPLLAKQALSQLSYRPGANKASPARPPVAGKPAWAKGLRFRGSVSFPDMILIKTPFILRTR